MLKITIAQINPTIGDLEGNLALHLDAARRARHDGADLVVFPELSLTGYYPADLLDDEDFRERLDRAMAALLAATREVSSLHWVVGAPTRNPGAGKAFRNSLLVIRDGELLLDYHKQLLPTYNVFDERRHFEPGPDVARVLRIGGAQVGFMICEDGWNDDGKDYTVNPFQRLADSAPDLIVSINASPSHVGKRELRHEVFRAACWRHRLPLVFVNQIGGHDQLVYDGASFAIEPEPGVVFEARRFEEQVVTLGFEVDRGHFASLDGGALPPAATGLDTMAFYRRQIVLGLRDYARRCGFERVVVGASGGIDSALTLALAVEALGADRVMAITMPSRFSSSGSVDDSKALCDRLGIALEVCPIEDIVGQVDETLAASTLALRPSGLALENLQARVRGTLLMTVSNARGHLLLTTGNKSEIAVGYCTLYGDTNGGLGLIGDLYKTEVFALSRHLNEVAGRELIPAAILDKPPSAELAPDQRDTDSLPPYELLDEVLKLLIEGERLAVDERAAAEAAVAALRGSDEGQALLARIKGMIARNEYKRRQAPPIVRLRARAFGSGRQLPIAARHY
ncbi:NAD+ synthase/NAD+ synthase (glutamine-hydrolysing) [Mitsuaria sp. PDC51]|uniref:NAD+ synthase n=1 Tax=Mitsuaria sp. PDC51 TaxID=1881035 RepID=UPI0008EAFA07|nr:NAD+ synthase [Mitsuaria sp. PDC51]SFR71530.1 NAD+ synthase/NAD+ synthase (glutamine-hydrolysing) [Mitsuaria sp. PDC51]